MLYVVSAASTRVVTQNSLWSGWVRVLLLCITVLQKTAFSYSVFKKTSFGERYRSFTTVTTVGILETAGHALISAMRSTHGDAHAL